MAEADYRLMTEATGQRIAAALEALSLGAVSWSDVVNNLTATEKSVLDARQGKALKDLIDGMVSGVKGDAEGAYRHGDVNITPANIGAVAKAGDTMTGTLSVDRTSDGDEANVEAKSAAGSIYLYSTGSSTGARGIYSRSASNVPVGIIEVPQDNHTIFYGDVIGNAANVTGTVQVDHGGTGATTEYAAISKLFDISRHYTGNYPNAPGVYMAAGANFFTHLQPGSLYGILIIIGRVYAAHFYIDSDSNMYVGFTGEVFGEPTAWKQCTP